MLASPAHATADNTKGINCNLWREAEQKHIHYAGVICYHTC